ncbi:hemolytic lectin [Ascodesmis nigricans]|uniref:Hemolytic lectin n=1 Tax=Ascodesmis nigricans TaxID=341454 RepID=A0A4S2MP97_9PEZI|nr:hemolytic lectin [Ascodesmis nigricans]
MTQLYIPPTELTFRLRGYASELVLFSRFSPSPLFGHNELNDKYGDQEWHLVPGTGKYAGYYLIKSRRTSEVIFSRYPQEPRVGTIDSNGKFDDNYFKLEPGAGKMKNYFRLRSFASDYVLFSRTHGDPTVYNYPGNSNVYDDQYFSFVFEDMEIVRCVYNVDEGKILESTPEVIGKVTQRNDTNVDQTVEFSFQRSEEITHTFEYSQGYTIMVGSEGKVGVPFVAEGSIKTEVTNSHTLTWGSTTTETKTYTSTFPATAPPHTQVTATVTVTRSTLEVPFSIYSRSVATGYEVATHGVYHGVTYWDVRSDIKEQPL